MGTKELSEEDVKLQFITPAIEAAGWDKREQIRMEYTFTAGRIIVRGGVTTRGKKKSTDYTLFYRPNLPLAVVEAKKSTKPVNTGLDQAIEYATALDIPYAFSSNGKGFVFHNLITGQTFNYKMDDFPSPEDLYISYCEDREISPTLEKAMLTPYYFAPKYKTPRYYQRIAINRTVEAVACGGKRALLVCATGTGKTYMAFQIIYRLWKAGLKKKILFLADRNILVNQTISGDFKPFGSKMVKVENKKLDSSYEIYLSLYQQLSGEDGEEPYKQFKPEFFDLVVVDECHRGSAKEDSAWRKVLDYFSHATHIGCTATPVETADASSQKYFGKPIYEYSLKQGIEDGFLAPYKVIRVGLDKDLIGYRPSEGETDDFGYVIEDRVYDGQDFDKTMVLDQRTITVAKRVTEFLKKTDRFSKTIVFCVDIEHAIRMHHALIQENRDLYDANNKYIMRITGDNADGKKQLEYFIDEESTYPVIAVTSKLMTTGVDAKTCKLIVLDSNINSMTEFKQIIGRGTRVVEDYGKTFFTIMDFRGVSRLFADPEFDGLPEVVVDVEPDEDIPPMDDLEGTESDDSSGTEAETDCFTNGEDGIPYPEEPTDGMPKKYYLNGVPVAIASERVQYLDKNGKLITESLKDFSKKNILNQYATLDDFLRKWSRTRKKQAIVDELMEEGVFLDAIREESGMEDMDDFDLICHLAYDKKPLTKRERINNVKKRGYLYKYSEIAQQVLNALLDKYADEGIREIEDTRILQLSEFTKLGSPLKIVREFGGKEGYLKAVHELENEIFTA